MNLFYMIYTPSGTSETTHTHKYESKITKQQHVQMQECLHIHVHLQQVHVTRRHTQKQSQQRDTVSVQSGQ